MDRRRFIKICTATALASRATSTPFFAEDTPRPFRQGEPMNEAIKKAIKEKARVITVGTGDSAIELLRVEPGTFTIGSPANEEGRLESEGPTRKVSITRPFY